MRKLRILVVIDYTYLGDDICEILIMEGYDSRLEKEIDFDKVCLVVDAYQPDLLIVGGFMGSVQQDIARHFSGQLPLIIMTAKAERSFEGCGIIAFDSRFVIRPYLVEEVLALVTELLKPLVSDLKWLYNAQ